MIGRDFIMANNRLETVTNALYSFQDDGDECDIDEQIDYAFHKVVSLKADCATDVAYRELIALFEQKGYRDGFAAGIKFIMQTVSR